MFDEVRRKIANASRRLIPSRSQSTVFASSIAGSRPTTPASTSMKCPIAGHAITPSSTVFVSHSNRRAAPRRWDPQSDSLRRHNVADESANLRDRSHSCAERRRTARACELID